MKDPLPSKNGINPAVKKAAAKPTKAKNSTKAKKRGRAEENSVQVSRLRKIFAILKRNQDHPNPEKRFPTLKQIGEMLEPDRPLSKDTVSRDLAVLKDQWGLPVDFVRGRGGHGFTEPVAGFPLDVISEEQVYYLIQSVQMLGLHWNAKAFAEIRRAVKKACLGITLALGVPFEDIEDALSFHVVGFDAPAPVDPALFKAAMRAILRRKEVRLEHRSAKRPGEVKEFVVEPLHLSMINHALYLWHYDPAVAADAGAAPGDPALAPQSVSSGKAKQREQAQEKEKRAIRKFALTRIGKFEETGRTFARRAFDIDGRLKNGMGAFDEEEAAAVRLRFTAKLAPFILERRWHESQAIERLPGGGIELSLEVAHTPELEAFVLRWAGNVEVVEPNGLRERMRELGEALAKGHA